MTTRNTAGFLMLVAAFVLATWLHWLGVPLVALFWGGLRPAVGRPAFLAGVAASSAWGFWLLVDGMSSHGALGVLQGRLSGVMHLPALALPILTLVFPALLAWSAAALASGIADFVAPHSGDTP